LKLRPLFNRQHILKRVARGDEKAFALFFEQHWPQVYGTSLRLTKSSEKARDLAQDIFLKIWEQRVRLADVQQEDAYVYTLARNTILDFLRKKLFDTENIDLLIDFFADQSINPQQKLEYKELGETLQYAIDQLPGKVKDVFVLSRVEGLTHEQIAQRLNISVVSSKTYIVRALQTIREFMAMHSNNTAVVAAAGMILHSLKNNF
jgi:RNA polymerase sigma factor, sigma-70 family